MPNHPNEFHIIAGEFKGRRIRFPAVADIRPTKSMIRETLFNWLAPYIENSVCLDMFAGSGSLAFEALSRGAEQIVMADQHPQLIDFYQQQAQILGCSDRVITFKTLWPNKIQMLANYQFDIIFLDPPFNQGWLPDCCRWLIEHHFLGPEALIYMETNKTDDLLWLPENWQITNIKKHGGVMYSLVQVTD